MQHPSWIEINQAALAKNIRYLKKRIGSARFVSVVKGNAYGHGMEEYLPLAEKAGVRAFAVSDASEAFRANKVLSEESHLIVMGMIDEDQIEWAILNDVSFFVFCLQRLESCLRIARALKKKALVHLELETGMHRTGLEEDELEAVAQLIKKNSRYIKIEGICTHYAGAESIANYLRVQNQYNEFERLRKKLKRMGIVASYYHSACSAAALIYPHTIMDMVRFGIAQYGYWPSMETKMNNLLSEEARFTRDPLKSVLSWKTRVMSVKGVQKGSFINYGNFYLSTKDIKIATIPVGYHHGYSRSLGNSGQVLIRGKRANVIGIVNMNMFIVNVSQIRGVQAGDEVVLIGSQGEQSITVASFAELTKMVNYELLTRLPYQIPRIIV